MSEAPLMNDDLARSPTGEILDQATSPPSAKPEGTQSTTPTAQSESSSQTTDGTSSQTTTSEQPKPEEKPSEKPSSTAPETYADFTLPDGVKIAPETLAAATPIFKELGLSQEAAQKLVSFHAEQLKAAPDAAYTALRTDWRAKTEADADMKAYSLDGKTGIEAVKVDIGRALGALGEPALVADFKAAMDLTGAGDHPAFVKAMWLLAQKVSEGKPVAGKNPSPEGQRAPGTSERPAPARSLYPNLPSAG